MKINCGPTPEERNKARHEYLTNWHPFFCLWPRRLGPNDCRWLETIQRKKTYHSFGRYIPHLGSGYWQAEYRP